MTKQDREYTTEESEVNEYYSYNRKKSKNFYINKINYYLSKVVKFLNRNN